MANISCAYICGHSERRSLNLTYPHFHRMLSDKVSLFYLPYRPAEEALCALSCIKEKVAKESVSTFHLNNPGSLTNKMFQ